MVSAAIHHNYNSGILNLANVEDKGLEETQFDYILIRRNPKNPVQDSNIVAQWFSKSEFVANLSFSEIPTDKIFPQERFHLKFNLAEKYNSYFPLLRGLFQFRKPSGLTISADRSDRSFSVEFNADIEEKSLVFFETVFHWLSKEVRFKEVLREVIRFEQKINREQVLLLSALQNAVK